VERWFWRSCFSERYSGQTNRVARADITEMVEMRNGTEHSLGEFSMLISADWFLDAVFRLGSARSATFVLLLASQEPRSFISGAKVKVSEVLQAYNRREFHHMYPQAVLKEDGVSPDQINCLANMAILSRADNNRIRRKRPSEYRELMPSGENLDAILRSAVARETLFADDFEAFRQERARMLADVATALIG
jgi:hypothetical protein